MLGFVRRSSGIVSVASIAFFVSTTIVSARATWFGVCSYRKLKLINGEDVGIKHKCPICNCDLVRVRYRGVFSQVSISRRGEILSYYGDDGKPLWEIVAETKFKGG